jgi:hypothetical protein
MNGHAQAKGLLAVLAALVLLYVVGYVGIWQWGVCRIDVPPGYSLLLRYRGPWPIGRAPEAPEGTLAQIDSRGRPLQVGILEAMPGPGRHFYSPLEFETQVVQDTIIPPGKLGVVVSKFGKALPPGTYLVDAPGFRGIRRKVLTPGRYRINSYAYDVKVVELDACVEPRTRGTRGAGDTALIPPGYVGVVTNKTDNPRTGQVQGIQDQVLQPGLYYLNPEEKRIDILSIGYNETTLMVETRKPASPEPTSALGDERGDRLGRSSGGDPVYVEGKGIEFPSNDGFPIHLDFTVIWGILPEQAPDVVRKFGTLVDVNEKVILPQIGSICRLHGSKRGAVDLLVGESREAFQDETAAELEKVLASKNLSLLFGLTRHIYVPRQVREPIQKSKIAVELTKTREQEQLTARAQADLTEAKAKVTLEERRTAAETEKLVAQVAAEGEKQAREIEAMTDKIRAEIDARTAEVEARTTRTLGEANAEKVRLTREAEAERFQKYVQALGGPEAYNKYMFAEGLPPTLNVGVFYAGPGTLWTDLKGFEQTMLARQAAESAGTAAPVPASSSVVKPSSQPAGPERP